MEGFKALLVGFNSSAGHVDSGFVGNMGGEECYSRVK